MADPILHQRDRDITTITLNRPEAGNRQDDATWARLTEMIGAAAKESRLIVFKGAGADFCLGREAMTQPQPLLEAYAMRERSDTIFNLYGAFRNARAPIIGVVQGRAAGLGCALAALCDVTIAAEEATFQLPEMGHRIMPTIAMSALVDRVPRKAATYLVYSTEPIDAARALMFGIVSNVVPGNRLEEAARALVERLATMPLPALLAVKEYAAFAFGMNVGTTTQFARNLHAAVNTYSGMRS
ncbi:MAG TPA: enoyl-CoA hydratase/isomerase family protein [Candidatus Eisenbacteria bacterium]|nr:enoyl-CoA hydratase/isomerase family protein [Candidatus Eisenbacteria bacterium]